MTRTRTKTPLPTAAVFDHFEKVAVCGTVHMLWTCETGECALVCRAPLPYCNAASPRDAVTCKECRRKSMAIIGGEASMR